MSLKSELVALVQLQLKYCHW